MKSILTKGTLSEEDIERLLARPGMLQSGLLQAESAKYLSQAERLSEERRQEARALLEGLQDDHE